MAEYVVSFLLEKLACFLIEEAGSLLMDLNLRHQVEWIQGELRRMRCFLKDADSEEGNDERIKNWISDIRDIAYDTDDMVDSFIILRMSRKSGLVTFFHQIISRREMNNQIERIKGRLQQISNSKSVYGIVNIGKERADSDSAGLSRLHEIRRSFPRVSEDVVGLSEDIKAIESDMVHGDSRLSVISIVGMAGIGKTTLAKKVFVSTDVKKHFDCSVWVYVSQDFRAKDTLLDLMNKLMGQEKTDFQSVRNEELIEMISSFLQEKRYMVVLDDMWKCDVWFDLKAAFPDENNGSRIIITTRFKEVAQYADLRVPPRVLSPLNDEDSWRLFSMKLCCSEWKSCSGLPPWAEDIGRKILKKCGGLPLAIVVIAGLLSRKDPTFNEWLKVFQSLHWQLRQDPMQCEEILYLSYKDLPYYLKPCFLYFGLFPEDFEISANRLMLLWIAEGFVVPRGQEPLEDVAEDYLEELISRSMIEVVKRKSNGKIKTCHAHDLLRELAISKAKEDRFLDVIHGDTRVDYLSRSRRLAIQSGLFPVTKNTHILRALLCFDLNETGFGQLKKLKLLRVLYLEGVYLSHLDSAIGNLIHLRYLGLRGTWLKKLPSSVKYLMNLQTLDLRSTLISPIPRAIWNLHYLRNLYFNKLKEMTINPPRNAALTCLQNLQGICIGVKTQVKNGLDKLTNIRELELHGELFGHEAALANWISMSNNLICLKLKARTTEKIEEFNITNVSIPLSLMLSANHFCLSKLHLRGFVRELCDIAEFPPNLTELSLQGTNLMNDPMPKLEKLPNLRILKLKRSSYVGRELVCSSGGFPQLHFLKLSFVSLEKWIIEDGALCNLKQLEIIECKKLKIVPRGLQPVTSLRELKLGFLPYEFGLKVKDREGENWYRIYQVPPI